MPLWLARRLAQYGPIVAAIGALLAIALKFIGDDNTIISTFVGTFLIVGGLLGAWMGRKVVSMTAPENVIARWQVSHDEWRRYVAICQEREAMPDARIGAIPIKHDIPSSGTEILALKDGFLVLDSFYQAGDSSAPLDALRVIPGSINLFELDIDYSRSDTAVSTTIRIPVPQHALEQAASIEKYWQARVQPYRHLRSYGSKPSGS